jgi:hypothetical protein
MKSSSTIKTKFSTLILLVGLVSGIMLALLLWLDSSSQLYFALAWISFGVLALLSSALLRRASRRSFILLASLASAAIIYLFPQLFGPACNGMPIAFAGHPGCTQECTEDCRGWDAEGHCSWSKTICWWECPDPNQPPVINGSVACDQWGQNGWCIGNETLSLTASDPQGQTVQISGDTAGYPFACPSGPTCSIPLSNGSGAINYLVRSMTTLTAGGSTSWALDNTPPQINGSLNGTAGNNNWFISNTMVSASAADATSGLAVFEYSLDNAAYTAYTAPITLSDGTHTLTLRAMDSAGNQNTTTQSINVDTITPIMDLSLSGTSGSNGWYASNVQITASANDSGSRLASLEYALDGGAWTSYIGTLTLTDGAHSLSVRALDAAGNVTQNDQQIHVDTTTPLINLSVNGTPGAAGWYVSDIQVSGAGSDSGSGLVSFEYAVDGGAWTDYTSPLPYSEGQRSVQFRATDQAGNTVRMAVIDQTCRPQLRQATRSQAWRCLNMHSMAACG